MIILHVLVTYRESYTPAKLCTPPRLYSRARMDHPHRFHYPSGLISQSARPTTARISRWIVRT